LRLRLTQGDARRLLEWAKKPISLAAARCQSRAPG
jgi:hypothetical protein